MRYQTLAVVFASFVVAVASAADTKTVKGPSVSLGKGKAWTWVKLLDGKPVATGLSFTEKALMGLPKAEELPVIKMPGMTAMPSKEWVLDFPKEIRGLPYDHFGLDWNPKGHDPMMFYGVPHFDFHFYVISSDVQNGITAMGDDMDRCSKRPDEMYVPSSYILPPGTVVPKMGTHWIDPMTPELHGKPFTTTFIYGSYDGKTAFYEPMIALSYLQTKPSFSEDLKLPKAYDLDGYYPNRYSITFDKKHHLYTVALENLAVQKAGVPLANSR
jgi:hypothetical protein